MKINAITQNRTHKQKVKKSVEKKIENVGKKERKKILHDAYTGKVFGRWLCQNVYSINLVSFP